LRDYLPPFGRSVMGGAGINKTEKSSSPLFERCGFILCFPPYTSKLVTKLA
jgi:hypothetical protein